MNCHNSIRFIKDAIESILNQTYGEFEFIIVDDNSSDGTYEIASQYANSDARIRLVRAEPRFDTSYLGDLLNVGVRLARHDWVARMDADDVSLPDRFRIQLDFACKDPEVVGWGSYCDVINESGKKIGAGKVGPLDKREFMKARAKGRLIFVTHPTSFLRRDIMIKAGLYDARLRANQDVDLINRMAEYGAIRAIPVPLLCWRVHSDQFTVVRDPLQDLKVNSYLKYRTEQHSRKKEAEKDYPYFLQGNVFLMKSTRYFFRQYCLKKALAAKKCHHFVLFLVYRMAVVLAVLLFNKESWWLRKYEKRLYYYE